MNNTAADLLQELQEGVRNYLNSSRYTEWLTAVSRFHHYSFNNICLILMQYPGATQVASFRTWKQLGCYVRKGEKGIRILVPVPVRIQKVSEDESEDTNCKEDAVLRFKVGHVFDISQVDGELPDPGIRELTENMDGFLQFLQTARSISPVPIRFDPDIPGTARGYYDLKDQEIVIRDHMPQAQTAKTILHELAHAFMHADANSKKRDRATKEVQAESVAFICSRTLLGLESVGDYSFGYIGTWSSSLKAKELIASLKEIRDTSDFLIRKFQDPLEKGDI